MDKQNNIIITEAGLRICMAHIVSYRKTNAITAVGAAITIQVNVIGTVSALTIITFLDGEVKPFALDDVADQFLQRLDNDITEPGVIPFKADYELRAALLSLKAKSGPPAPTADPWQAPDPFLNEDR